MKKIFILASVTFLSGAAMAQSAVATNTAAAKKPLAQQAAPVVQNTKTVELKANTDVAVPVIAAVADQPTRVEAIKATAVNVPTPTTPIPATTAVKATTVAVPAKVAVPVN